ncbi:MAG: class II aldolase/adducin family protein [Novosphingobium sp.]|nr:class II aldolase/adducin family protein [Novosphingobium sp.]
MATITHAPDTDTATEAALRRDLAAAFRLCALRGWDDHIATHMSARLPDGTFLLNPFGMLFEEITASSLMRVDLEGNVISPPGHPMNPAAFTIHSGVLAGRPDVNCVIHLHTLDGAAVSTMDEGLLPLTQTALQVIHDVAYHDYEGVADDLAERERLQADLGDKNLLILRNHGTLTTGETVGLALYRMMTLEFACTAQIRALGTGRAISPAPQAVQDAMPAQVEKLGHAFVDLAFWPAMLRKAARDCPGFDS